MTDFYLVGETHGTKQCPERFVQFVIAKGLSKIALEIPARHQSSMNEFLEGKRSLEDLAFLHPVRPHDGRVTSATRDLVEFARQNNFAVYCVDTDMASSSGDRDRLMAEQLKLIPAPVAYLCGWRHAQKANPESCAGFLGVKAESYIIRPELKSTFYNFGIKQFIQDELPWGFDGVLAVEKFTIAF